MLQEFPSNSNLNIALEDAVSRYIGKNPRSYEQHKKACAVLPGGNTRTVLFVDPFPCTVVHGEGAYLTTLDGHSYVDFLGEYTAGIFGHSNSSILDAARAALSGGIVLGGHTTAEQELAELLCARFPSLDRVRFTNSGTEANLMAISLARAATNRKKILVFHGAYHGGVFVFAGGGGHINAPFEFILAPYNDLAATLELMDEHAADLAAVVVEPMMGAGGCIPADLEFLEGIRQRTAETGTVLIFDEVMTSRLGPGGLQEITSVTPDMTTLGKYIGGGFSFGAFGGTAELMERFDPRRPTALPHAGTFNNNILTMSAGLAAMRDVYTPNVARRLNAAGDALRQRLNSIAQSANSPMQFTGWGSMMTVHMCRSQVRSPADAAQGNGKLRELFFLDLLDAGIWLARRGMINISLPMGDVEFDRLSAAVEEFITVRRPLLKEH